MNDGRFALLVVALCLCGAVAEAASPGMPSGFLDHWVRSRLTIVADWTRFSLADSRRVTDHGPDNKNRANFLGSLWGLDPKQHYFPDPSLEYRIVSVFGLGASYDQRRARTLDWGPNGEIVGDGDVEIRGPQVYVFGRYPNRSRVTPYARVGLARYRSRFFVLPSWSGGGPGRAIQVDGTSGRFFAGGFRISVGGHAALDAFYRYSFIRDVAARAYGDIINKPNQHRNGALPMRNSALGVGAAYGF